MTVHKITSRSLLLSLAAACAAVAVPLIHLSTDFVFDGTKTGAYDENDPVKPIPDGPPPISS